ncbi:MAG: DNA polymerase III subunit beta [Candidatus Promineifilaceae bacterium]
MKITCQQENLSRGLSIVGRAVSTRSTLPVLANVLLASDGGRLKLSATNLEMVVTCWINAKVEREGSITIPARTLSDLVGQLPKETVELEVATETHTMHIECGRTKSNLRGIDAQEFPLVPDPDLTQSIRLQGAKFKQMINQVAFAAASDDTRPTLTGVSVQFEGKQLKLAATDAFRLSVRTAELEHATATKSVIVPARALGELARVITNDDEVLHVMVPEGRNQIIFKLDNIVLVSQLIDGNFPDFSPIIPKKYNTRAIMSTASLLQAAKTAGIFARESSHTARIRVNPGNELTGAFTAISATSQETGDNVVQVDATVEGGEVEVAFNVKYLTDVLNVLEAPQVALESTSPMEPGVIRPVGSDEFFHIIMPMHFGR